MPAGVGSDQDAALVQRVLEGDTSAFAALYRAHAGVVAQAVRDQLHDAESIADAVQETFARALERLHTLRDANRFRAWLLAIARHTAVDHRRIRSRVMSIDDWPAAAERAASDTGPEELTELRELVQLVRGCVAGLSRRDATAVSLVAELGFSPAEVAAALDVTPGAAKVAVHRARRRLRDALALELLVRRGRAECAELCALYDRRELVRAGRHLRECPECADQARSEVEFYANTAPQPRGLVASPAAAPPAEV